MVITDYIIISCLRAMRFQYNPQAILYSTCYSLSIVD
nr:MAG TPA: hypothetical protein [Caudoviricetes sp.]